MPFTKPFPDAFHRTMLSYDTYTMLICPYQRPETGNYAVNRAEYMIAKKLCYENGWVHELHFQHPNRELNAVMRADRLPLRPARNGFMLYSAQEVKGFANA